MLTHHMYNTPKIKFGNITTKLFREAFKYGKVVRLMVADVSFPILIFFLSAQILSLVANVVTCVLGIIGPCH